MGCIPLEHKDCVKSIGYRKVDGVGYNQVQYNGITGWIRTDRLTYWSAEGYSIYLGAYVACTGDGTPLLAFDITSVTNDAIYFDNQCTDHIWFGTAHKQWDGTYVSYGATSDGNKTYPMKLIFKDFKLGENGYGSSVYLDHYTGVGYDYALWILRQ